MYFGLNLVKIYTFSSPIVNKMEIEFLACWKKLYFRVSSFELVIFLDSFSRDLSESRHLCSIFEPQIDAPQLWKLWKVRMREREGVREGGGISTIFP